MREIRTSGLTRGSNGIGANRPLLSTLLVDSIVFELQMAQVSQNVFFDLKYWSAKVYEHAMLCSGSFEIG